MIVLPLAASHWHSPWCHIDPHYTTYHHDHIDICLTNHTSHHTCNRSSHTACPSYSLARTLASVVWVSSHTPHHTDRLTLCTLASLALHRTTKLHDHVSPCHTTVPKSDKSTPHHVDLHHTTLHDPPLQLHIFLQHYHSPYYYMLPFTILLLVYHYTWQLLVPRYHKSYCYIKNWFSLYCHRPFCHIDNRTATAPRWSSHHCNTPFLYHCASYCHALTTLLCTLIAQPHIKVHHQPYQYTLPTECVGT